MKRAIIMNTNDNCASVLSDINIDDMVRVFDKENNHIIDLQAKEVIKYGNKIALKNIKKDESVIKYGEKIAIAIKDIYISTLIHVHNTKSPSIDVPESIKLKIIEEMGIK